MTRRNTDEFDLLDWAWWQVAVEVDETEPRQYEGEEEDHG